jgi:hypothetical protein
VEKRVKKQEKQEKRARKLELFSLWLKKQALRPYITKCSGNQIIVRKAKFHAISIPISDMTTGF